MEAAADEARIALITHPQTGAEDFARRLVERRLAACVNLVAVKSVYRWQGRIEAEAEVLLVAKTGAARMPGLERVLADEHPYDLPELVALAPTHVERSYLTWLLDETRD